MKRVLSAFLFLLVATQASAGGECFDFVGQVDRYIGNQYVGPQLPTGICFEFDRPADSFHSENYAYFQLYNNWSGVFLMGDLAQAQNPACGAGCIAMEGHHFEAAIRLNFIRNSQGGASLEDVMNGKSYELVPNPTRTSRVYSQ